MKKTPEEVAENIVKLLREYGEECSKEAREEGIVDAIGEINPRSKCDCDERIALLLPQPEDDGRACHGCGNDISDRSDDVTNCGALECGGEPLPANWSVPPTLEPWEMELAAVLLDMAGDEFGNHGCNDFNLEKIGLTSAAIENLHIDMAAYNGAPDDRNHGKYTMDWYLMHYLAYRLRGNKKKPRK